MLILFGAAEYPAYARMDNQCSGMRFSTFRSGRDRKYKYKTLKFKLAGEEIAKKNVERLLAKDKENPEAFKFTMNTDYRKCLMNEFTGQGGEFESRYSIRSKEC